MNTQSLIITGITGIVNLSVAILLIQLFTKKIKSKTEDETGFKLSYPIWIGLMLIAFGLLLQTALRLLSDSLDIILGADMKEETTGLIIQKVAVFSGFVFVWFVVAFALTRILSVILLGKRSLSIEIERNNIGYVIINGVFLIIMILSLSSVFESFLRLFMPVVETPFYH